MNWQEVCADTAVQDIPYKIELNRWGQIVMSPAKNKHSVYQGLIQSIIQSMVKEGLTYPECPIRTEDNVKVADVVWISRERYQQIKNDDVCSIAPEICIEIKSSSNTLEEMKFKKELYFEASAVEFWLCNENGEMSFFNSDGQIINSAIVPNFSVSIEL